MNNGTATRLVVMFIAMAVLAIAGWPLALARQAVAAAGPAADAAASAAGEVTVYQDGNVLISGNPDYSRDVKVVRRLADGKRLVNYPAGYQLDVPEEMEMDFRYSPAYVRVFSPALDIKISREYSPYGDVEVYLRDYPNRFIAREDYAVYRQVNGIELLEDTWMIIGGRRTRIISFRRGSGTGSGEAGVNAETVGSGETAASSETIGAAATADSLATAGSPETQNEYLLAYILVPNQRTFYAVFFRTDSLAAQRPTILRILQSFSLIGARGTQRFNLDLRPVPGKWNTETQALYDRIASGEQFMWGIFYPWALTNPEAYQRVASIEERLGFSFPIILHYIYPHDDFPAEGMQRAFDRGQVVELTMQVATFDNGNARIRNANFDLLDGRLDEAIRRFARGAKAFGHPFLFRLNNEMNTDWSQYSGVCTLNDVDIYIKVWQRIYRIFEEEGVDNAIWVFNPNSRSYPPMNWNHQVSYYPGNGYVHLIGLTGYNTGDYYNSVTGEHWASFRSIYEPLVREYRALYGRFPWLIGEFASSSVGGDKAQWIRDMFAVLPEYPEIKAAVWWSYADFDYRPGREGIPARRYWLDERDEYLEVFREGLRKQGLLR